MVKLLASRTVANVGSVRVDPYLRVVSLRKVLALRCERPACTATFWHSGTASISSFLLPIYLLHLIFSLFRFF